VNKQEKTLVKEAIDILQMVTMEMPRLLQDQYRKSAIMNLKEALDEEENE
jgi:hypothetical protein